MKIVTGAIRAILTIAILLIVWGNAHWSVALTLTLITLAIECGIAIFVAFVEEVNNLN